MPARSAAVVWWFVILLTAGACPSASDDDSAAGDDDGADDDASDDDGGDDDGGDDDTGDPGVDDLDYTSLVGRIVVSETTVDDAPNEYPYVSVWGLHEGPFVDGVYPEWVFPWTGEVWERTLTGGDCALYVPFDPFACSPPCAAKVEYCAPPGQCEAFPAHHPAGDLVFQGLAEPLTLSPNDIGLYVLTVGIPDDLFATGATVSVDAAGGETPAFSAAVTAPPPLQPALDCELTLTQGQDLVVTWTAEAPGTSRVRWEMAQGHHAANGPLISCESEDTGSLTVPAALIDAYDLMIPTLQTLSLSRFDRDVVEVAPGQTVALEVASIRVCLPSWE